MRPPRTLTLALTGSCNLRCQHCLVEAEPKANESDVPAETAQRIASEFSALGGETICLTGGEPLLHPRWLDILAFCSQRLPFRSIRIQTNGTLLGDPQVDALRALRFEGLSIQVSLDGCSPRTHDRVRGRESFLRTVEGIRRLAAAGLGGQVSVAFTEMRHNVEEIPALLELADTLGVGSFVSGTLVGCGRALEGAMTPPTPDQYRSLISRYVADARFRELYEKFGNVAAIEWWKGRLGEGSDCCRFVENPYMTHEGTIYPSDLCRADDFAVSGGLEKPLATALLEGMPKWSRLVELQRRRHGSLPMCQECAGRIHCAGGCIARAHAATGELMAVEDRCELRKAIYRWCEEEPSLLVPVPASPCTHSPES